MPNISGNEGYSSEIARFIKLSESVPFEELHQPAQHLFPKPPALILDIGAGIGRDAAAFADMGHQVVAAEPTIEFLEIGQQKHPSPSITWLSDGLPQLSQLEKYKNQFDFILCHLVWQHLDKNERLEAMKRIAELLKPDGLFDITLRHGPKGLGDQHFEVCTDQAIAFAERFNLDVTLRLDHLPGAIASSKGVTWTRLVLKKQLNK